MPDREPRDDEDDENESPNEPPGAARPAAPAARLDRARHVAPRTRTWIAATATATAGEAGEPST